MSDQGGYSRVAGAVDITPTTPPYTLKNNIKKKKTAGLQQFKAVKYNQWDRME